MNYCIITFGCQMNKSDSERISQFLEKNGYKRTSMNKADLIIVNMCSVRQSAVDRVYGLIPKLKSTSILTGCILKKDKTKFKAFDYILDNKDLDKWPIKKGKGKAHYSTFPIAYVPISRGCNNFCSYCVVPYTRGREICRDKKEIICQVKQLVKKGFKEIWLLGQNVNSYKGFPELLKQTNNIPGKFWLRFTSPHPKDFSDKLIKSMKQGKNITPYLNLPLQSGDNKILKKMNRNYTIEDYLRVIKKIRKHIPDITLSTDIIVGFPGETKKQFQNTEKVLKQVKYDMAYIAQYSPRPGTIAYRMKDNISQNQKKQRERILTEILKKTALQRNKRFINKTIEVLPIEYKNNYLIAKSFHNKTIKFKGNKQLIGKFVKIKVIDAFEWGLKGKSA